MDSFKFYTRDRPQNIMPIKKRVISSKSTKKVKIKQKNKDQISHNYKSV